MMRRLVMINILLVILGGLYGFDITLYDGSRWEIDPSSLLQTELLSFSTLRDKEGRQLKENWEGIALLPWLDKLTGDDWHSLRLETKDGYVLSFSRLELNAHAAYIALKQEGKLLSAYDIRFIIPTYRENKWPRNLKSLSLEAFKPMLPPRQIFVWEHAVLRPKAQGKKPGYNMPLLTLMRDFFGQEAAEVLFVDKQMKKIRLRFPEDLTSCAINANKDDELRLYQESDTEAISQTLNQLGDLIYLQCGPIAFVKETAITDLAELGKSLGWDLNKRELKAYKSKSKKYRSGSLKAGMWLGWE